MRNQESQRMTLSIMILTRNRKQALLKALESCIECILPSPTEFVIVDNASEDGTKETVDLFFDENDYHYSYCYLPENIGVAAGRNEGYKRAKGRYVYFLDDDGYIDGPKDIFFQKMIDFCEKNENVFAITTRIYDIALDGNRALIESKNRIHKQYKYVLMFHGGSVLINKDRYFDQDQLFLMHHFRGMQELYPSLRSFSNNRYIINMDDLVMIHDPDNKLRFFDKKVILLHYIHATQIKQIFYPIIVYPILYTFFGLRIIKHLGISELRGAFSSLNKNNELLKKETIPIALLVRLVRDFGFAAVF